MIVPMRKVSLIALASDREEALDRLREVGVVHVQHVGERSSDLDELEEKRNTLFRAMLLLPTEEKEEPRINTGDDGTKGSDENTSDFDAYQLADRVYELNDRNRDLQERSEKLTRESARIRRWGSFDPTEIRTLGERGVDIELYELPKEALSTLAEQASAFVVSREKNLIRIALVRHGSDQGTPGGNVPGASTDDTAPAVEVTPVSDAIAGTDAATDAASASTPVADANAPLPASWVRFPLPERGIRELGAAIERNAREREKVSEELANSTDRREDLDKEIEHLDERIEFEQARVSMAESGTLVHLTGYLPSEEQEKLSKAAGRQGWALLFRDPEEEEAVPTLVRNKKAIGIIKPVFQLLGTLPGYREHDISLWFLLFFTLFFAMIIGDGGYGFVFLVVSVIALIRTKRKGKTAGPGIVLLTVLSIATVIWGALSGTWFGSKEIAESVPFKYLIIPGIYSFNPLSSQTVKYFCFIIGTVQILIAHGWNFLTELKVQPRIRAFAQLGWISLLVGIFYLVLNLVLDPKLYPFPSFGLYLLFGGVAAVVLFSNQEGNFFKGVFKGISGLLTTFLDGIGAFADVISYIRLFAVGLATVEIAKSFNGMAAEMGNSVVGIVGAVLVLAAGHSLNIAMGALSVIVHGVRLNMLEFSSHLGMEWTGTPYQPFRKREGSGEN